MKDLYIKKAIIVSIVLVVILVSAILVSVVTGRTSYPSLSDPDGIFYERLDDNGNVIYTITNKELFEEIKGNDGIEQVLLMADSYLLQTYVSNLTDEQIANKILELTYGTSDATTIAEMDDATKTDYENNYQQSMILAGYEGNEEAYARIILARELYTHYIMDLNEEITQDDVMTEYVSNYFEDIQAIKIRFTSSDDAYNVMKKFNLLVYNLTDLREYLGYKFTNEAFLDSNDEVAQAYTTVNSYYFNADMNILNSSGQIVYTLGTNDIYTDASYNEYTLDDNGNLVNIALEVVVSADVIFNSSEEAIAFKDANTVYYTVTKDNPYDLNEVAKVYDSSDVLRFTVDKDGKIYDELNVDVTETTDLIVNKIYTSIDNVSTTTLNNSRELTTQEILAKYIAMYNYVYGEYRDALPADATASELVSLNDAFLTQNYDETYATQTSLAAYMFKTLDLTSSSVKPYSVTPKTYAGSNDDNYYMVYKLAQPDKVAVYQIMLDYIQENIILPSYTVDNLTLPTTGWYGAKITWYTSNSALITTAGVVTLPTADTAVTLTYTITANGVARTGTKVITVLASGTTEVVRQNLEAEVPFKTILNDPTMYGKLYTQLLNDAVYGDNGNTNISDHMIALRQEYNLTIYDYYLQLDYQQADADYVINDKGNKEVLFSLSGHPGDDSATYEVTADDYFNYVIAKNSALYLLYASQLKELVYSPYFEIMFGSETDLSKNKSTKMDDMYTQVKSAKDYYVYLQNLYATYGLTFTYASFNDYIYLQYSVKSESELLSYFVLGALQPFIINEAVQNYDLVPLMYDSVKDYYDNYFSLNVTHLVIYVDFNEDGSPDNFNDYYDGLTVDQQDAFDTLIAQFEAAIDDFDGDYTEFVTAYQEASRDDATWGAFKQAGIWVLTEDLNQTDDNGDAHSVTYSGDYGVKDTYVPEYVSALLNLYNLYQLEENQSLDELQSSLITTEFGYHLILVTPGDDFAKPTAAFTETDPANPIYSAGSENPDGMPTLEQLNLYATYYFYSIVYDLTDAEIESQYGITVPDLPATVTAALDVYFKAQLEGAYVLGTVNIILADSLQTGTFVDTTYNTRTDAEIKAMMEAVKDVYYQALYSDYLPA